MSGARQDERPPALIIAPGEEACGAEFTELLRDTGRIPSACQESGGYDVEVAKPNAGDAMVHIHRLAERAARTGRGLLVFRGDVDLDPARGGLLGLGPSEVGQPLASIVRTVRGLAPAARIDVVLATGERGGIRLVDPRFRVSLVPQRAEHTGRQKLDMLLDYVREVAWDKSCEVSTGRGIQIHADDAHAGLLPRDSGHTPESLTAVGFSYDATTDEVGNPDVSIHAITAPYQPNNVLGQLVHVVANVGNRGAFASYYRNHDVAKEHWHWSGGAWPSAFDIIKAAGSTNLPNAVGVTDRWADKDFSPPNRDQNPMSVGQGWQLYEIRTGTVGEEAIVGYLNYRTGDPQEWLANPGALVGELLPANGNAWRFRQVQHDPLLVQGMHKIVCNYG